MSDYEALKAYGHSAAKAAEIVLDARRGDRQRNQVDRSHPRQSALNPGKATRC